MCCVAEVPDPCGCAGVRERGVWVAMGRELDGPQVGWGLMASRVSDGVGLVEFQVR